MKKIVLSSIVALLFATNLSAYEKNGDLEVKWTGYKLASKVGVSGTFNKIDFDIKKSDDLVTFLKSAKVKIDATSLESKDEGRNFNITSTLFSLASAKNIQGSISSVDEKSNTLVLDVVMNGVTKPTTMKYTVNDGKIVANGVIDILDFNMSSSYKAFTEICGALHENVSYSDVNIEFSIPFK